jgi:hypothetical protein
LTRTAFGTNAPGARATRYPKVRLVLVGAGVAVIAEEALKSALGFIERAHRSSPGTLPYAQDGLVALVEAVRIDPLAPVETDTLPVCLIG